MELEAKMLPSMYPGFVKRNRIWGGQLRLPDSIDDFNFPLERFIVKVVSTNHFDNARMILFKSMTINVVCSTTIRNKKKVGPTDTFSFLKVELAYQIANNK